MPDPFFIKPVPDVVDIFCEPRSRIAPEPISRVRTDPFVDIVPPGVSVTVLLSATVILPIEAVAKVTAEF